MRGIQRNPGSPTTKPNHWLIWLGRWQKTLEGLDFQVLVEKLVLEATAFIWRYSSAACCLWPDNASVRILRQFVNCQLFLRRFCHFYNFQKRQETELVDTSIHFWWMGVPFVENKISLQRCRRLRMWMKWTEGVRGNWDTHGRSWKVTWFPYFTWCDTHIFLQLGCLKSSNWWKYKESPKRILSKRVLLV